MFLALDVIQRKNICNIPFWRVSANWRIMTKRFYGNKANIQFLQLCAIQQVAKSFLDNFIVNSNL